MIPSQAIEMGEELLRQFGLAAQGWRIELDAAKRRFGICRYSSKSIGLSAAITMRNPEEKVKDTILHEIAHALVGPNHGHNEVWKSKAEEVGARPERCYDETVVRAPLPWEAKCKSCGQVSYRSRAVRPGRRFSCSKCHPGSFDQRFVLEYKRVDFR